MLPRQSNCWLPLAFAFLTNLQAAEPVDYAEQIKPILQQHCFACHGPLKQAAELRLDTGSLIFQGGASGVILEPGRPETSLLMERLLESDLELRMPQQAAALTGEQIALLRRWIAEGASFPSDDQPALDPRRHWAFLSPVRPPLPENMSRSESENPIDGFIRAGYQAAGVQPVPLADPAHLLRRVYLDLVGLPPTRLELGQFLADPSPLAYQQIVDRLLQDPRYGERWGRHWMDVWRYSDWYGRRQENDVRNSFPYIWRWRDWIIRSLNEDKGYDQMIREMLAADELYPVDDERIVATGFIVRNWFSLNYDTWMRDLVEHTGKAFLGLRMNCALCHDHKYDPITQEDYFRFRAFFEPLEVRQDRVPGGPRLAKYLRYTPGSGASLTPGPAGLVRIYDHTLDASTQMYRLGDQRDLFDDRAPVAPGVPGFLGELPEPISMVELPPEAHYPGLKRFVQQAEVTQRQQALEAAVTKVRELQRVEEGESPITAAQTRLKQAQQVLVELDTQPPSVDSGLSQRDELVGQAAAFWDFESHGQDEDFLEDRNGHGHLLKIFVEGSGSVSLQESDSWPADSALHQLSGQENHAAVVFRHGSGQAMLQTSPSVFFKPDQFTAMAIVRIDRSELGLFQALMGVEGSWALVVEGVDEATGVLKMLSWNAAGGMVTAPQKGSPPLALQVGQEYFVGAVAGAGQCQLVLQALKGDHLAMTGKGPLATPVVANAEPRLRIGDLDGTAWWHGLIDNVAYWSRTLELEHLALLGGTAVMNEKLLQARQEVRRARAHLEKISLSMRVAQQQQQVAAAELAAIEARVRADDGRFRDSEQEEETGALIREASRLEREAKIRTLEAAVVAEELAISGFKGQEVQGDKVKKELADANARLTRVRQDLEQVRQQKEQATDEYTPLSPSYPQQSTGRRRALAGWITDRQNPLTARVAVNHIWMRHFGRPLVESVMDLGLSGKQPTHPELLDWLAVELMEQDWSMKHLHRIILHSRTYRLQTNLTTATKANLAVDKDNRWWWKMDDRRLESEIVRDAILGVAGQLDQQCGGPEQDPAEFDMIWRKSLYFAIYPEAGGGIEMLSLFDPPDPCDCYQRSSSVVPQQSLALVNSRLVLDQSRLLTRQLVEEVSSDPELFVQAAFEQVLSRLPRDHELTLCQAYLEKQEELLMRADLADEVTPEGRVPPSKDPATRAKESLIRVLFNHNDFITIH